MKKIFVFLSTTLVLVGILWGVFLIVQSGGGFSNSGADKITNTGEVRNWTKKDFDALKPLDWDDNTDSQYDQIIKVFGKPDDVRNSEGRVGKKTNIKQTVLSWREKKYDIHLGFYKYSKDGKWILHDKTWTNK